MKERLNLPHFITRAHNFLNLNYRNFAHTQDQQYVLFVPKRIWKFEGHLFAEIVTDCFKASNSCKSRQQRCFIWGFHIFHSNAE